MRDPRVRVMHQGEELSLVTRSSDGQMLFLANMASKMNHDTPLGSRIAEVHNGSSLFTGDAGQGESNIRRWLIEHDWLEAIVALPLNLFYNTGIATYIWVLTNRKPDHRKGKIQLIDATQWFKPLRKNLGKKNCELAPDDIQRICDTYLAFQETPQSKIFPNAAFGYWKVTVERPLRLHSQLSVKAIESLRFASGDEDLRAPLYDEFSEKLVSDFPSIAAALETRLAEWGNGDDEDEAGEDEPARKGLPEKKKRKLLDPRTWERDARLVDTATALRQELGGDLFTDHNVFRERVEDALKKLDIKLSTPDLKLILRSVSWRVESAPPVIAKTHKTGKAGKAATIQADPLHGLFSLAPSDGERAGVRGKQEVIVEYEPDPDLRDTEQIPFLEAPPSGNPAGLPSDVAAVALAEAGATAKACIETFMRREVLPYTPDAWIKQDATRIGYEISFTRHFYQPQPLRSLDEIRADILAVEKEAEGLLDELLKGGTT
jgi:type I restriction enzyme M protein